MTTPFSAGDIARESGVAVQSVYDRLNLRPIKIAFVTRGGRTYYDGEEGADPRGCHSRRCAATCAQAETNDRVNR